MKKAWLVAVAAMMVLGGCQRSGGDVWQDTKSCGRHVGKGFRSLGGKHTDSRQVLDERQFAGPPDEEFIPLEDESLYHQIVMGDHTALRRIDADSAIPQSAISPGEMGSGVPGIDAFSEPTSGELAAIFKRLHFNTDDYVVQGQENLKTIREIAQYLQDHPDVYVFIEGHCDERGPAAYNLALGARRSNAVRNHLIKEGADLNHLFTVSYGKEQPLVEGHDSRSWKENRRAQFKTYRRG